LSKLPVIPYNDKTDELRMTYTIKSFSKISIDYDTAVIADVTETRNIIPSLEFKTCMSIKS